jgi:hypothetical protein
MYDIELDINFITRNHLSPNEYVFLYLYNNDNELLYKVFPDLNEENIVNETTLKLQEKGYIKIISNKEIDFRKKFNIKYNTDNKYFEEFFNTFPLETPDGRRLRPVRLDSAIAKRCKKKYEALTKNKLEIHEHILKCLKAQLEYDRKNLLYLNNIDTWLNQQVWTKYEDLVDKKTEETKLYGSEIK